MRKRFKGYYGDSYSISETKKGTFRLKASTSHGRKWHDKEYKTYNGARIALGKITDGVKEVK